MVKQKPSDLTKRGLMNHCNLGSEFHLLIICAVYLANSILHTPYLSEVKNQKIAPLKLKGVGSTVTASESLFIQINTFHVLKRRVNYLY